MKKIPLGMPVRITFWDHAEGRELIEFDIFGRLTVETSLSYTVETWTYTDPSVEDYWTDNVKRFTIVKKAVTEIVALKPHKLR